MRNFDELTVGVMVNEVNWNCEKARCIVNDVYRYFDKNDGAYPKPDTIQNIKFGFNEIAMKLSVVFDLLDRIVPFTTVAIKPPPSLSPAHPHHRRPAHRAPGLPVPSP